MVTGLVVPDFALTYRREPTGAVKSSMVAQPSRETKAGRSHGESTQIEQKAEEDILPEQQQEELEVSKIVKYWETRLVSMKAGNIKKCQLAWSELTSDCEVLDTV